MKCEMNICIFYIITDRLSVIVISEMSEVSFEEMRKSHKIIFFKIHCQSLVITQK